MSRNRTRSALIALTLFDAVTAIGGGAALVAGLEDGRFPAGWLVGTPFGDYTGPGLILAVAVGGSAAAALIALLRGSSVALRASLTAGLVLVGWVVGEVLLVRADNEAVSPMEALYLAVGAMMVGLALRLGRGTTQPQECWGHRCIEWDAASRR